MKKVLLYSGGMDSWLINCIWRPDQRIYVNMHTRYSGLELEHIHGSGVDVMVVDFPLVQWERPDAVIPLRNLYLAMVACNVTEGDVNICLGALQGDRNLDKTSGFAAQATTTLNFLYQPQWWIPEGRRVKISVDFRHLTKAELLQVFLDQGGSLEEAFKGSFTCYHPTDDGQPCWHCKPCFQKFMAFDSKGYVFPTSVLRTVIPYIASEIAPRVRAGDYGRGEKVERLILDTVDKYREYCR